jgi:WD40 repeat protein/serine/threonine protein kinase
VTQRVEALFDLYLDLKLGGQAVEIERFLADHPDLEECERERLRRLARLLGDRADANCEDNSGRPSSPVHVGPYRILRELGRGGQSTVLLAEDTRFARKVALKVLARRSVVPTDDDPHRESSARLKREAEVVSRLDHPGICVVYEMGANREAQYIAMRYIEGETLAKKIADARREPKPSRKADARVVSLFSRAPPLGDGETGAVAPPPSARRDIERILELGEKCARALHVAHEAGIIHRDVKPGNVMVTPEGDPVLLDFGLARDLEDGTTTLTVPGGLLGTPSYMSPEQLAGPANCVDRRTDVYALGVTLYECLTLVRPFEAPTRELLYRRILADSPCPPGRLNPSISRDFDVALETALAKDADQRYQTALDFAEDLRRIRLREPIRARPAGIILRSTRWSQRNALLASALGGLFLALASGLVVSLHLLSAERKTQEHGEGQRLIAESRAELTNSPRLALLLAIEGAQRAPGREGNDALLEAIGELRERRMLQTHPATHTCVTSPDGRFLVTASRDGAVELWDADGWKRIEVEPPIARGSRTAFSGDGKFLAAVDTDGTCRLWSTGSWSTSHLVHVPGLPPGSCTLDATGRRMLTWCGDGADPSVQVWDLSTEAVIRSLRTDGIDECALDADGRHVLVVNGKGAFVWRIDGISERPALEIPNRAPGHRMRAIFSPDGRRILVAGALGRAEILDIETQATILCVPAKGEEVGALAFRRDGRRVVVSHTAARAEIWDVPSARPIGELTRSLSNAAFSPDGAYVVDWGSRRTSSVWDAETGEEVAVLAGHEAGTASACFSSSGASVVTSSGDGTVRDWSIRSESQRATFASTRGDYLRACFDPRGKRMAAATARGWVQVIELESHSTSVGFPIPGLHDQVRSLAFAPDGLSLVTTGKEAAARLWDASTGAQLSVLEHPGAEVYDAEFSPDGALVVTAADDGLARIWDARKGRMLRQLVGHARGVRSAKFEPSGERIITASEASDDSTVRIWDARRGGQLALLQVPGERPISACISPDGRHALAACWGGTACLWDLSSGVCHRWQAHPDTLTCAMFSPDGTRILTANADPAVRIWDAESLEEVMKISDAPGVRAVSAEFSADGRWILTVLSDGAAHVWPADPLRRGRELAPRGFTDSERKRFALGSDFGD